MNEIYYVLDVDLFIRDEKPIVSLKLVRGDYGFGKKNILDFTSTLDVNVDSNYCDHFCDYLGIEKDSFDVTDFTKNPQFSPFGMSRFIDSIHDRSLFRALSPGLTTEYITMEFTNPDQISIELILNMIVNYNSKSWYKKTVSKANAREILEEFFGCSDVGGTDLFRIFKRSIYSNLNNLKSDFSFIVNHIDSTDGTTYTRDFRDAFCAIVDTVNNKLVYMFNKVSEPLNKAILYDEDDYVHNYWAKNLVDCLHGDINYEEFLEQSFYTYTSNYYIDDYQTLSLFIRNTGSLCTEYKFPLFYIYDTIESFYTVTENFGFLIGDKDFVVIDRPENLLNGCQSFNVHESYTNYETYEKRFWSNAKFLLEKGSFTEGYELFYTIPQERFTFGMFELIAANFKWYNIYNHLGHAMIVHKDGNFKYIYVPKTKNSFGFNRTHFSDVELFVAQVMDNSINNRYNPNGRYYRIKQEQPTSGLVYLLNFDLSSQNYQNADSATDNNVLCYDKDHNVFAPNLLKNPQAKLEDWLYKLLDENKFKIELFEEVASYKRMVLEKVYFEMFNYWHVNHGEAKDILVDWVCTKDSEVEKFNKIYENLIGHMEIEDYDDFRILCNYLAELYDKPGYRLITKRLIGVLFGGMFEEWVNAVFLSDMEDNAEQPIVMENGYAKIQ